MSVAALLASQVSMFELLALFFKHVKPRRSPSCRSAPAAEPAASSAEGSESALIPDFLSALRLPMKKFMSI